MNRTLLLFTSALIAVQSVSGAEVDLYEYTMSEPSVGIATEMGSCRIYYKSIPEPNPECTLPATLSRDGEVLYEVLNTSSQIQRFIMQADNCYTILFTTKMITRPGVYTVHVPEGYMTFDGGAAISAEQTLEYVIPYPKIYTVDPPTGNVTEMPRRISITFEGVKSIVDNKTPLDSEGAGGIRFDSPEWYVVPQVEIDGNTITFLVNSEDQPQVDVPEDYDPEERPAARLSAAATQANDEPYTYPGEYMLAIYPSNLTFTMEDGSESHPDNMCLRWYIPNIPTPSLEPAPGEVKSLNEVTVTLQGDDLYGMFNTAPSLYSVNEEGDCADKIAVGVRESGAVRKWDTNSITFAFKNPVTVPGEYILKIGKSSFAIRTEANTLATDIWNSVPYEYHYTVVGESSEVESPASDIEEGEKGTVYNIAGVAVARDVTREALRDLPAGLYIFNGRKIIVK